MTEIPALLRAGVGLALAGARLSRQASQLDAGDEGESGNSASASGAIFMADIS